VTKTPQIAQQLMARVPDAVQLANAAPLSRDLAKTNGPRICSAPRRRRHAAQRPGNCL